jgi:5-hydroxyisourate hydrolase
VSTTHGLSTHVLDTATGLPAAGMQVRCERNDHGQWKELGGGTTDADGRIKSVLGAVALATGHFRLTFATGAWHASRGVKGFFPSVSIEFEVTDAARHHHVPLLLSPFGYSTYRGS